MRKMDWKCIWRNYGWKLSKSKERNRYPNTGSTEGSKQVEPKQIYTKTYYKKMAEVKDKEKILKAGWEKQIVKYKETLIRLSASFSKERLQTRRVARYTQSSKREKSAT